MSVANLQLDRHAIIEASAGTGKTYTLERLIVRLVVERRLDLGQILVMTFTEKATGELKHRLRAALREASASRPADALLTRALDEFDDAPISTIHGFCQRVLEEYAFENRQTFEPEVVDDPPLYHQQLRELQRKGWGGMETAVVRRLLETSGYPRIGGRDGESGWERIVLDLAGRARPAAGDVLLPPVGTDFQKDRLALEKQVADGMKQLGQLMAFKKGQAPEENAFVRGYGKLNINSRTRERASPICWFRWWKCWNAGEEAPRRWWSSTSFARSFRNGRRSGIAALTCWRN